MIKSLAVYNYQSHKKSILKFHEGVNVIVGESDAGKSAIIKALRLVITNKPSGEEFISHWSNSTVVKVNVDRKIVKRTKFRSGDNLYHIGNNEYRAFGQSVPEDVSNLFNILDVNIQKQLDRPFLLDETSGEVAKYINKLVNLEVIGRASKNAIARISNDKRLLNQVVAYEKELKESLTKFDWLVEAEDKITKLEQTRSSINKLTIQISDIERLILDIEEVKANKKEMDNLLKAEPELKRLSDLTTEIENESLKYDTIKVIISSIEENRKQLVEKLDLIRKLEAEIEELMGEECPLCGQDVK